MTELTNRYVGATLRSIPEKQRADIEAELRALIGDAVEARLRRGDGLEEAERAVLTDLGDPDRLAARYAGRSGYLIGPDLYFIYRRLVVALLAAVVPVVMVVVALVEVSAGRLAGSVVAETIGAGLAAALQVAVWSTLGFAVIERTGGLPRLPEWSLSRLRLMPVAKSVKLGETVSRVVTLALGIAVVMVLASRSPVVPETGVPLLKPALAPFWVPLLIVVLAAQIIFELGKYRIGRWTRMLASVNLVLNGLFAGSAVYLLVSGTVLNQLFFDELGWPVAVDPAGPSILITAAVFAGIVLWEIVDGFRRAGG